MKQRLNKLDSNDYDNIECWQIVESFNKGQVEWARRQLHGINQVKEGDEESTRRKDDLQILLITETLPTVDKEYYFRGTIPDDYLQVANDSSTGVNERIEKGLIALAPDPSNSPNTLYALISLITWIDLAHACESEFEFKNNNNGFVIELRLK